jgi:hypothetical protein
MTDVPSRFDAWAPAREAPPPRSRLYRLEPIGIGTNRAMTSFTLVGHSADFTLSVPMQRA